MFADQKLLYHGSVTPNIKILMPRKRYTPGALGNKVPPAVYAGDDPFYCICHALPWSSADGFDLLFNDKNECVFIVPKNKKDLLTNKVYLYMLPKNKFKVLPTVSPEGHNFWSLSPVKVLKVTEFENVFEAQKKLGGKITYT